MFEFLLPLNVRPRRFALPGLVSFSQMDTFLFLLLYFSVCLDLSWAHPTVKKMYTWVGLCKVENTCMTVEPRDGGWDELRWNNAFIWLWMDPLDMRWLSLCFTLAAVLLHLFDKYVFSEDNTLKISCTIMSLGLVCSPEKRMWVNCSFTSIALYWWCARVLVWEQKCKSPWSLEPWTKERIITSSLMSDR